MSVLQQNTVNMYVLQLHFRKSHVRRDLHISKEHIVIHMHLDFTDMLFKQLYKVVLSAIISATL